MAKFPKLTSCRHAIAALLLIAVFLTLTAPVGRTVVAQSSQCLATGQVVNGDTTGLDVRPCPEPSVAYDNDNETTVEPLWNPPPGNFSTLYWGYEADLSNPSRLNAYRAIPGNPMVGTCIPMGPDLPPVSNGRGVAFDPLDGKLWISRLTGFGLPGDNMITKVPPPLTLTQLTCQEIKSLFVHFADGSPPQNFGFGALDIDDSKHIWAAGNPPAMVNGDVRNYFYQVNRNNGLIIHSCFLPAISTFEGNDSLTFARLSGLPGSGRYLLTDNGGFSPANPLLVIDVADCHKGRQVTPVVSFPNPGMAPGPHFGSGVTGIDFEWLGLLNTDGQFSYINSGTPPFAASTLLGPTLAVFGLEDIALCGFRAKFGGIG